MKYYLMIDIGASSGRHMLGHMQNGRIAYEEIHRFTMNQGSWKWHPRVLLHDILDGMVKCRQAGKIPVSMGIDTFGVDHGLLDKYGEPLDCGAVLRDGEALMRAFEERRYSFMDPMELYERTGIPDMAGNNIYQLLSVKERMPSLFGKTASVLPMPDFLNYLLTGVIKSEYTYATTMGLVNLKSHNWDRGVIEAAGLNPDMFNDLTMPGTFVGKLRPELKERVGYDVDVLQVAAHDTASAYLTASPRDGCSMFISSGTWSLAGAESFEPVVSEESLERNLANEGNYEFRYRILNGITGTIMMQRVKNDYLNRYSFEELMNMAKESESFPSVVDVNSMEITTSKETMEGIIRNKCLEAGLKVPETLGEALACIYRSIAEKYKRTKENLEICLDTKLTSVNLFSGGCRDAYLNQLTADVTGLPVYAGPVEAATVGNMIVQMIYNGSLSNLDEARKLVETSFDIIKYDPM